MAGQERAKIDPDFSLDDWRIEEKPARPRPNREEMEEAAGKVGFRKRDAVQPEQPAAAKPASIVINRRRTGRTEQLNVRMTAETKAKFKSLADAMGWSEAIAFEKAVELLEDRYK